MKKKYIIFTFIFALIFTFIFIINNKYKENHDDLSSKKLYIYDSWKNDITTFKDDEILYQFPIYDFNSEIELDHLDLIELSLIDATPNVSLTNYNLEYTGTNQNINFYTLSVYIKIDKLGLYKLNNLNLEMTVNNNVYDFSLGDSIVKIVEKTNDLDMVGGSAIISKKFEDTTYDIYYEVKNLTNQKVNLKELRLNGQTGITILESNIDNIILSPNESREINIKLKLDKNINNSLISFNLVYEIDNELKEFYTSSVIIADPVPLERLKEIITN